MSKLPLIDISPENWDIVHEILQRYIPDHDVWAFGSRAQWLAKEFSDLDLAVIGQKPMEISLIAAMDDAFKNSALPFKVDLVDWANITPSFQDVIKTTKVEIQRPEQAQKNIMAENVVLTKKQENKVPEGWQAMSFGNIFTLKHGFAFKGEYFTNIKQKAILVTPGNFAIGGGFQSQKSKYYSGPINSSYVLNAGDIVITMTDLSNSADTLGYSAIIPNDSNIWLHNQRIGLVVIKDKNSSDPMFINYVLRTHDYRSWVVGSATGTTVKHTSPNRIESFCCLIPPLPEQRAIAHILGTLDDKIALLRQTNAALEAMAQAMFKSWFVDFDPVRAKAEGREPDGIPAEALPLFPDELVPSELGLIPKGWKCEPFSAVCDVAGGSTPSTKESTYWDEGTYCWATPKDLSGTEFPILIDTERKITRQGLEKISSGLLPMGTVLMSSRAPIGYMAIAEIPVAINQGFIAIKPLDGISNLFLLQTIKHRMDEIKSRANGSTFMEISKSAFRPILTIIPPKPIMATYDSLTRPFRERLVANIRQSDTLAQLRDSLLPRLMSGRLRVKDAERELESL